MFICPALNVLPVFMLFIIQDSWSKGVIIYFVKVAVCLFENLKEGLP